MERARPAVAGGLQRLASQLYLGQRFPVVLLDLNLYPAALGLDQVATAYSKRERVAPLINVDPRIKTGVGACLPACLRQQLNPAP